MKLKVLLRYVLVMLVLVSICFIGILIVKFPDSNEGLGAIIVGLTGALGLAFRDLFNPSDEENGKSNERT